MKNNNKILSLIIWLIIAIGGVVMMFTNGIFAKPKNVEKNINNSRGDYSYVDSIYSEGE